MTHEICIAGFGGQGVLSLGQMIAYSAMIDEHEVSWMPSYGPEMRGGTAHCTVIVSDKKISSPIVSTFDVVIAFNQPSIDKFESKVKPNGFLFYEKSAIINLPTRSDIKIFSISALEAANEIGAKQIQNVIFLGALLSLNKIVKHESVIETLKKIIPPHRASLLELNFKALSRGGELVQEFNLISGG